MSDTPGWAAPGPRPEPPESGQTPGPPSWQPPGPPAQWGPAAPGPFGPPGPGWAPRPPKPGIIPLRPLGLGEILDGAVSYIRSHPKVTLGLAAVIITVTQLIQVPVQSFYFAGLADLSTAPTETVSPGEFVDVLAGSGASLFGTLLTVVATTILNGLLIVVVSRSVLGRGVSAADTWAIAKPRLLGLLGLSFLIALLLIAVVLVAAAPIVLAALAGAPGVLIALLAVLLVLGVIVSVVYLAVTLSLAAPAYMLERIGVVAALRRSRKLVGRQFWRILGILLLANVIALFIQGVIGVPFALLGVIVDPVSGEESLFAATGLLPLAIGGVGTIIGGTITAPFLAGVTGLLYVDQRIRREALDLELARAAGTELPGQSLLPEPPSQPPGAPPAPAW